MPASNFVILIFFCFAFSFEAIAHGVFEVKITQFINNKGLDQLGRCCANPAATECTAACRTSFRICLTHHQSDLDPNLLGECSYGSITTPVLGANSFDSSKRKPFQFNFTSSRWPGYFTLVIDALGKVNPGTDETFNFGSEDVLLSRLIKTGQLYPAKVIENSWITPSPYVHRDSALSYAYRMVCYKYYYGADCSTFCQPRDDLLGHYSCDEMGNKVCRRGWSNRGSEVYCRKAVCNSDCSENGECVKPNTCKCSLGWKGADCSQCLALPACEHGFCLKPFECKCEPGWGGQFCNQDLNYCINHQPCRNGGVCSNTGQGSYTCSCPAAFTGVDCEVEVNECASNPCGNNGTCVESDGGVVLPATVSPRPTFRCPNGICFRLVRSSDNTFRSAYNQDHRKLCVFYNINYVVATTRLNCHETANFCNTEYKGLNRVVDCTHTKWKMKYEDMIDGYLCLCRENYSGLNCEKMTSRCTDNQCRNGGTCVSHGHHYSCQCPVGWTGKDCRHSLISCSSNLCRNGGVCQTSPSGQFCLCQNRYFGKFCQNVIKHCADLICLNGGICSTPSLTYQSCGCQKCKCLDLYSGARCESYNTSLMISLASSHKIVEHHSDTRIVVVSEKTLNTSQWIGICFGSGILVIILIVAASCLAHHRKKSSITKTLTIQRNTSLTNAELCSNKTDSVLVVPNNSHERPVFRVEDEDVSTEIVCWQSHKLTENIGRETDCLDQSSARSSVKNKAAIDQSSRLLSRQLPTSIKSRGLPTTHKLIHSQSKIHSHNHSRLPTYEEVCQDTVSALQRVPLADTTNFNETPSSSSC